MTTGWNVENFLFPARGAHTPRGGGDGAVAIANFFRSEYCGKGVRCPERRVHDHFILDASACASKGAWTFASLSK
jgi:hypothetical protein